LVVFVKTIELTFSAKVSKKNFQKNNSIPPAAAAFGQLVSRRFEQEQMSVALTILFEQKNVMARGKRWNLSSIG
jgi:hypothetical protein